MIAGQPPRFNRTLICNAMPFVLYLDRSIVWRGKRETACDFEKLLAFGESPPLYLDAGPALNMLADCFCPERSPVPPGTTEASALPEARLNMALI